ncbi:unnamed protein product, partial [Nesidiocoris tenuis]
MLKTRTFTISSKFMIPISTAYPGGDGCFLVRPSSKHMMTLQLWYKGRSFNIPIRQRDDNQISLGTLKPNER